MLNHSLMLRLLFSVFCFASFGNTVSAQEEQHTIALRSTLSARIKALVKELTTPVAKQVLSQVVAEPDSLLRFVADPLALDSGGRISVPSYGTLRISYDSLLSKLATTKAGRARELSVLGQWAGIASNAPAAAIGGLSPQTTLWFGITDFLIERARDEVALTFVADLQKAIGTDSRLAAMFAYSASSLAQFQHASPAAILPALRASALQDFESFPDRLASGKILKVDTLARNVAALQTLALSISTFTHIKSGSTPVSAIGTLSDITPNELTNSHVRIPLRLLGLLAREYDLSDGRIKELFASQDDRRFFVAFLLNEGIQLDQQGSAVNALVKTIVQKQQLDFDVALSKIKNLQDEVGRLRTAKNAYDSLGTLVPSQISATIVTAGELMAFVQSLAVPTTTKDSAVLKAQAGLRTATRLMDAIGNKDFPRAVVEVLGFIDLVSSPRFNDGSVRYVAFLSSLASAKTPDDVSKSLSAAAEPVGSFRSKRDYAAKTARVTRFGLNAYLGLGFGGESATDRGSKIPAGSQFGVSAPIGFEYSVSTRSYPSVSFFLPVVDLGSLANYRLSGGELAGVPEVGFQQVLAPGLYAVFGLTRNYPLSVGVGGQYSPYLRRDLKSADRVSVIRYGLFLAIDVPIFRF